MQNMMKMLKASCAIAGIFAANAPAQAAVVQSLTGGVALPIPALNTTTNGPEVLGGAVFTSNVAGGSIFGSTAAYDFGANGSWAAGGPTYINANAFYNVNTGGYASMTLTFGNAISGFLADFNWITASSSNSNSAALYAYDALGQQLEGIAFNNNGVTDLLTPGFWGFQRGTADIKTIVISNNFIGARSLSIVPASVPEPSAWLLMLSGFGIIGAALRRSRPAVRPGLA